MKKHRRVLGVSGGRRRRWWWGRQGGRNNYGQFSLSRARVETDLTSLGRKADGSSVCVKVKIELTTGTISQLEERDLDRIPLPVRASGVERKHSKDIIAVGINVKCTS